MAIFASLLSALGSAGTATAGTAAASTAGTGAAGATGAAAAAPGLMETIASGAKDLAIGAKDALVQTTPIGQAAELVTQGVSGKSLLSEGAASAIKTGSTEGISKSQMVGMGIGAVAGMGGEEEEKDRQEITKMKNFSDFFQQQLEG